MTERTNLVVVCAGDESLHPNYLEPQRNYDLCVVYFGEQHNRYQNHAEHYLASKGLQTQLLDKLFRQKPELLEQYEQFWLPDDDLETITADVNRMFDLFSSSDFYIAQPSLKSDSIASFSMLTCKGLGSCETNFIEIMCPLFRRRSLQDSVKFFAESATGWGVDELWSVRAIEKGEKLGIFDQVQVGHYRSIGSAQWYQSLEIDPHMESKALKLKHGLADRIPHRIYPLCEKPSPGVNLGLPASPPCILGGQSGSGLRGVAEILLLSKRMYLDLDCSSDYPRALDSKCMQSTDMNQGLAEPELIRRILHQTGSTDYEFSNLSTELQQELLLRGKTMLASLTESANDPSGFNTFMKQFAGKCYQREQWGWQEAHSMYFLPLWKELFGRFRFIHIVRDPRSIQDQLIEGSDGFYTALFGQDPVGNKDSSFEQCWAKTNLGVYEWAKREIPLDYLLLRVEDLAGQDEKAKRETSRLLNFVGVNFANRAKTDAVFKPLKQAQPLPRQGLVAEALSTFGYL
jgi:hypothetical protein